MSEKRGCFKVGCLGCLGLGAVILVILVILIALGWLTGGGEERMEALDRSHPLPATGTLDHEVEVAEPGKIVLDLHRGRFEIVPGPAGEPIRVEGRYDAGRFDLDESWESYGETGWIYRVSFDQKGFGFRPFIEREGRENRVRIVVPRDAPVALEGTVGMGESDLELGGLWVVSVDLRVGVGEHAIGFAEPLPVPMRSLRLDTSIGALGLDRLGNASPAESRIKHSIGETHVDLRGAWRRDAEVDIDCGVGECDVRVPRDTHLDLRDVAVLLGESSRPRVESEVPADAPTLHLSVSGSIGEVRVQ